MKAKPSDFTNYPWNSVTQNPESEIVAKNIMVILKRTGDEFRDLSFDEYKAERIKDGNFSISEKHIFESVIGYCKSKDTAVLFSSEWKDNSSKS